MRFRRYGWRHRSVFCSPREGRRFNSLEPTPIALRRRATKALEPADALTRPRHRWRGCGGAVTWRRLLKSRYSGQELLLYGSSSVSSANLVGLADELGRGSAPDRSGVLELCLGKSQTKFSKCHPKIHFHHFASPGSALS